MQKKAFIQKHIHEIQTRLKPWNLIMITAASVWLSYEFWRLTWDSSLAGAIDLVQRYKDIFFWFRGFKIYEVIGTSAYPPASYAILWPLLGWLSLPAARWLWAIISTATLVWLSSIFRRESKASTFQEKLFITLIPFSMYASGAAIGNGQLIVLVLPVLVASLLLMQRADYSWKTEFAACCLFLFALVKPTMTAPFFWIILFIPGRLRAALMIVAGYAGLSFFSALFQEQNLFSLVPGWISTSSEILSGQAKSFSQSNLHSWFAAQGIEQWAPVVSLMILILLGIWISLNRKADPWLIISAAAIVSRIWTYHAWYDDLLIAPAMIGLFRISKSTGISSKQQSALQISLFVCILFMIAPGGLYLFPSPWKELYVAGQVFIWISLLVFLIWFIKIEKNRSVSAG